jgi:hypothetical protein
MSLALYASPYNNNGIDNSTDNLISKKRLAHHNKTQKYYNRDNNNTNNQSDKVKNIIKKIHDNSVYNDSIDGVEMGDFSPLSPPESAGVNRTIDKSNFKENYRGIGIEDDNDIDNYNNSDNNSNINSNSNSVNALITNDNSNYYSIPSDNNNSKSSMQQQQQQQQQPLQRRLSSQSNQPNASNYLDSIEYNNLNNNYGDSKTIEEYYKKFSPNYSYGTVSNWNRTAQAQSNMNNKNIYANGSGSADNNYSSPFLPSLMSSSSTTNIENSILIEKLNYMIHLLEEQQDERTNNVTEEVILYCFLGVFMIFIVDSFTRVGKYVR